MISSLLFARLIPMIGEMATTPRSFRKQGPNGFLIPARKSSNARETAQDGNRFPSSPGRNSKSVRKIGRFVCSERCLLIVAQSYTANLAITWMPHSSCLSSTISHVASLTIRAQEAIFPSQLSGLSQQIQLPVRKKSKATRENITPLGPESILPLSCMLFSKVQSE
jgi:hypothetical protein